MTEQTISVDVTVSGIDAGKEQRAVIDTYEENIETFLRKNRDYGSSFSDGAKVESILKHGEVREDDLPDLVARQIFVRGMLDKISRFYQLAFEQEGALIDDESIDDTLLDLGNYSIMLASELRRYSEDRAMNKLVEDESVEFEASIEESVTRSDDMPDGIANLMDSDVEWTEEMIEDFMERFDDGSQ